MQFKGLAASIELSRVLEEARDIAENAELTLNSSHLLLALFLVENRAKSILEDRGLDADRVIDAVVKLPAEPVDAVTVVHHKTAQITESCGSSVVGTLHLLAGLCRVSKCQAYKALEEQGVRPSNLRTQVIRYLTGGMPRQYLVRSATPHADRIDPKRSVETGGAEPVISARIALVEPEVETEEETATDASVVASAPAADAAWREARSAPAVEQARRGRYTLDPETFPLLSKLGRNLTELAEHDKLDPLIGRQREVQQLVDILNKRRSNNPCLVGDPGVGKTAVVEGLAQLIVGRDAQVGALGEKILVELQMGSLLAGTQLRGAFAERLGGLKDEVSQAEGRIVLFIDEVHTLIGAGAGDGALDAANDLKTALARGEFPCIGATTEREYRRHIESDPALERRFQMVLVDEPSIEEAIEAVAGLTPYYSRHHKVTYRRDAIEATVRLADRWLQGRFLPGKAIDVLDLAGAWASRHEQRFVSAADVACVVAQTAGIPEDRLLVSDAERLLKMEQHLQRRIVSHEEAVTRISRVIRRNFAGFTSCRPMGSFLLLGPTGVGKTESARVLADFLFGSRDAITRIDMSEYMDAHSVSRLIGAPPGYVGHEEGGQLTEAVRRRPYQIILFDEVEKASGEVLNILLQLLEEGQLTDGRGRRVRFQNTVVMMTSNLGHEHFDPAAGRRVGFAARGITAKRGDADREQRALETARKAFTPELWNRIEDKLVFAPLERGDVERIAALLLEDSSARLEAERKVSYRVTDEVVPLLIERGGYDARMGARPMRRIIQDLVEGAVADAILSGAAPGECTLLVGVVDDQVCVID